MVAINDALAWSAAITGSIAAIAGIVATIGAWRTEITARWQAHAERLPTYAARQENQLHRQRFAEVWNWQRSQPDGDTRVQAVRWYDEWTGNYLPRRGGLDDAPLTPGLHSGSEDEAYRNYLDFLAAQYQPGRLGPPRPPLDKELTTRTDHT